MARLRLRSSTSLGASSGQGHAPAQRRGAALRRVPALRLAALGVGARHRDPRITSAPGTLPRAGGEMRSSTT
jgi:hypothetical protein